MSEPLTVLAQKKKVVMPWPDRIFFAASACSFERVSFRYRLLLLKAAWLGSTAFIQELRERFPVNGR